MHKKEKKNMAANVKAATWRIEHSPTIRKFNAFIQKAS